MYWVELGFWVLGLERVGIFMIERERENFILNESQIFRRSIATPKNFDEVQNEICRSQPIDEISNTLLAFGKYHIGALLLANKFDFISDFRFLGAARINMEPERKRYIGPLRGSYFRAYALYLAARGFKHRQATRPVLRPWLGTLYLLIKLQSVRAWTWKWK
jgi:hypothetical protein